MKTILTCALLAPLLWFRKPMDGTEWFSHWLRFLHYERVDDGDIDQWTVWRRSA